MATKLKKFPERTTPRPWDKWLDGSVWKVSLEEANVPPRNPDGTKRTPAEALDRFRVYTLIAARRRGVRVNTHRDDDAQALVIQAVGPRPGVSDG